MLFRSLDWITTGRDANSVSDDPHFVSATDLHLRNDVRTIAESWGDTTGLSGVVVNDIDGDTRFGSSGYSGTGVGSDLGADEGNYMKAYWLDISPISVNNPVNGSVKRINDTFTPSSTFKNVGYKRYQNFSVRMQIIRTADNFSVYDETVPISDLKVNESVDIA